MDPVTVEVLGVLFPLLMAVWGGRIVLKFLRLAGQ